MDDCMTYHMRRSSSGCVQHWSHQRGLLTSTQVDPGGGPARSTGPLPDQGVAARDLGGLEIKPTPGVHRTISDPKRCSVVILLERLHRRTKLLTLERLRRRPPSSSPMRPCDRAQLEHELHGHTSSVTSAFLQVVSRHVLGPGGERTNA